VQFLAETDLSSSESGRPEHVSRAGE